MKNTGILVIAALIGSPALAANFTPGALLRSIGARPVVAGSLAEIKSLAGAKAICTGLILEAYAEKEAYVSFSASASCVDEKGEASAMMKLEGEQFGPNAPVLIKNLTIEVAG